MRAERVRERHPGFDLVADIAQDPFEKRVAPPLEHDVEALQQRKPGFEKRRQLLVEERELGVGDALPPAERVSYPAEAEAPPDPEDVVAFFSKLVAQDVFGVRGQGKLLDVTGERAHLGEELRHSATLPGPLKRRFWKGDAPARWP